MRQINKLKRVTLKRASHAMPRFKNRGAEARRGIPEIRLNRYG